MTRDTRTDNPWQTVKHGAVADIALAVVILAGLAFLAGAAFHLGWDLIR